MERSRLRQLYAEDELDRVILKVWSDAARAASIAARQRGSTLGRDVARGPRKIRRKKGERDARFQDRQASEASLHGMLSRIVEDERRGSRTGRRFQIERAQEISAGHKMGGGSSVVRSRGKLASDYTNRARSVASQLESKHGMKVNQLRVSHGQKMRVSGNKATGYDVSVGTDDLKIRPNLADWLSSRTEGVTRGPNKRKRRTR